MLPVTCLGAMWWCCGMGRAALQGVTDLLERAPRPFLLASVVLSGAGPEGLCVNGSHLLYCSSARSQLSPSSCRVLYVKELWSLFRLQTEVGRQGKEGSAGGCTGAFWQCGAAWWLASCLPLCPRKHRETSASPRTLLPLGFMHLQHVQSGLHRRRRCRDPPCP